jgi:hypothetical protein
MIRVDLGEERDGSSENAGRRHGKWHWRCSLYGVDGYSRQPLLDACREIKSMGGDPFLLAGLFRDECSTPDLTCSVGWGADHTVDESGTPRFRKWIPFDPSIWPKLAAE